MKYSIRTVTAVADVALAVDLAAVKEHMRVDFDDEDADITAKLKAAQERLEKHLSRPLTPRQFELTLDAFPCRYEPICLPREGVTAVDSVVYTGTDGTEQTMDSSAYRWSAANPDALLPAFRTEWPTAVACEPGAVRIRFSAGYAEGAVPAALVEGVKRLTAYYYENREGANDLPPGVVGLVAGFRRQPI